MLRLIARLKGGYVIWHDSMNKKRKYVIVKGKYVGGKIIGTYSSIENMLKANPKLRRKK